MLRTQISLDDHAFFLVQGQDLDTLQRRIEDAVRSGGRFERFIVVGNREMSVLFTPTSRVAFAVETVQEDLRDTGDTDAPFGGFFDE
ncbi:hypothetical protein [Microbacterium trichothecenolyticum]|uniref:Uncharacterized protein n=1 Tax=Microbacterium trichothecenolyticum TaxID=69370 RepID=A0ABU0TXK2_MICTR|nr:hypothetical protein [Microbacterium trichothecenolyticum]MDQ1124376.1 hypothetical protein [Microbacterium trichothecenolyticum]